MTAEGREYLESFTVERAADDEAALAEYEGASAPVLELPSRTRSPSYLPRPPPVPDHPIAVA